MPSGGRVLRLLALPLCLGCSQGGEGREVVVRFAGHPAYGAIYADTRVVDEACPVCSNPVARGDLQCPATKEEKPCGTSLRHSETAPCNYCRETGKCDPCSAFETSGKCRHCDGTGLLGSQACFNCSRSGVCAACGGSALCDACGGTGKLKLPWSCPARRVLTPKGGIASGPVSGQNEYLLWGGDPLTWGRKPGETSSGWTVSVGERGGLREVDRLLPDSLRYLPKKSGSYRVSSGGQALHFEVIEATIRSPHQGILGPGTPIEAKLEAIPELVEAAVRWEVVKPDGAVGSIAGTSVSFATSGMGRYEFRAWTDISGLPARRIASESFQVIDLRIDPSAGSAVPSGVPVEFQCESVPPLPKGSTYVWSFTPEEGGEPLTSTGPSARVTFPAAGVYRLRVRSGSCVSASVEVPVFRVTLRDLEDRAVEEVRLAPLEEGIDGPRLSGDAIRKAPERFQVVVEDPTPSLVRSVTVSCRTREGRVTNPPVTLSLGEEGVGRRSRPVLFLADPSDDAAEADGLRDDAPDDPTLHAAPGGVVEVMYRGVVAVQRNVGPKVQCEIPLWFHLVEGGGKGFPSETEIRRILEERVDRASAVWAPYGVRFRIAEAKRVGAPRNLVLVRGRAAGVDEVGDPASVGLVLNGTALGIATRWNGEQGAMVPAVTTRLLLERLGPAWAAERFEKMFVDDPEAVVIRLRRKDGAPIEMEPHRGRADVSQVVFPLPADYTDGCEASPKGQWLSFDEIGLLLGFKGEVSGGVDVFVVQELRSGQDHPAFKTYPQDVFPVSFSRALVISWRVMDGSGRFPYALARAAGELLLPSEFLAPDRHSLFSEPLSEAASLEARKRVRAAAGAEMVLRGGALAEPK